MVTIQVKNIEGKTIIPVAGSELAAGYDIVAIDDPIIVGEEVVKDGEFFPYYKRIDYIEYHTALHISPQVPSEYVHHNPDFYHTLLHPRSSVRKYNLVLANSIGLVDNDYRGEIICCFKYIWQPEDFLMETEFVPTFDGGDQSIGTSHPTGRLLGKLNREKIYKKGDKIAQLVAEKTNPMSFLLVSELDATERGAGGFGSTDKPKIEETVIAVRKQPEIPQIEVASISTAPANVTPPDPKGSFGDIVDLYQKAGGIPIKRKYSDEVKEREQRKP